MEKKKPHAGQGAWLEGSQNLDAADIAEASESDKAERDLPLTFRAKAPEEVIRATGVELTGDRDRNRAINSLLTCAVEAHDQGRDMSYSRTKGFYTGKARYFGPAFTYTTILRAVEDCKRAGLLTENRAPRSSLTRRQSTLTATAELVAVFDESRAPLSAEPGELVRLVDENKALIDYRETDQTKRWRRELREANAVLQGVAFTLPAAVSIGPRHIECAGAYIPLHSYETPTLYRQFNRGSWQLGGRAYGGFWQGFPKAVRAGLLMDGEPVASADFAELHPRMLYAEKGLELQGSAYDLDHPREAVKLALLIAINAHKGRTAALSAFCNKTGWARDKAAGLLSDLERHHAPIADLFYSDAGVRLMRADSEIVMRSIRDAGKAGFAALAIHDELLVPQKSADKTREIMERNFAIRFPGVRPCPVKVSLPAVRHMPTEEPVFLLPEPLKSAGGPNANFAATVASPSPLPLATREVQLSFMLPIQGATPAPVAGFKGGLMPPAVASKSREARRTLGLTQDAMARVIGISRPQLANAERGRFGLGEKAAEKLTALIGQSEASAA